jgi:membrane carboxypeptidase/penicillin-binding protein PbpC
MAMNRVHRRVTPERNDEVAKPSIGSIGSRVRFGLFFVIVFVGAVGFAGRAKAAPLLLNDIKKAEKSEGCQSIPYESERRECNSISYEIEKCKDYLKTSPKPKDELKVKQKAFSDIKKNKAKIEEKKKEKEKAIKGLGQEAAAAVAKEYDNDIKKLENDNKKISDTQQDRESRLYIRDRKDKIKRCWNYRGGMYDLFDRFITKIGRESSFANEQEKKEAAALIKKIIEKTKQKQPGHKEQETAWKNIAKEWEDVEREKGS